MAQRDDKPESKDEPKAGDANKDEPKSGDAKPNLVNAAVPDDKPLGPGDPDPGQAGRTPGPPHNPYGPGKPEDTPLADARLSQPPSPPSLAQSSRATQRAVMEAHGELEQFTLWEKQFQVISHVSGGVLVTEINPANDPRDVRYIGDDLYHEAVRTMQEHHVP